jgi:hypothetical protein
MILPTLCKELLPDESAEKGRNSYSNRCSISAQDDVEYNDQDIRLSVVFSMTPTA